MIIGVLSDTHGTLHPRVVPLFTACAVELILHAGDVGRYQIIADLGEVAPVKAVRGNVDTSGRVAQLPECVTVTIEGVEVLMTHIGGKPSAWLPILPNPLPGVAICGHSHAPLLERAGDVLFLNPGAAGTRRRFSLPLSAAILTVEGGTASARLMRLDASGD